MASIFRDVSTNLTFWISAQTPESAAGRVIVSGTLTAAGEEDQRSKTTFFLLTNTLFFQKPDEHSAPVREARIRWVTVLPFTEYVDKEVFFGFSLKYKEEKHDFYVAREEDLESWLKGFESTSLFQDIEDDYSIGNVIGSGGQSVVYSAIDLESGARVAVKSFDKQLIRESERRFHALVHEIEVLRELTHPRIVALYRVYESLTHVQLVMEFIPGQELFQSLSLSGALTEPEARGFMLNLLEVLKCMEEHHVVHRDLKPENIILTDPSDKSQFKVIDFGFATKYLGQELQDTCGSPGYVAPEIILQHHHGPSVDIYSAGIIFYILLCGYSPFYSTKKAEVIKKNAKNEITFTGVWNDIDEKLVRLIKVMTNFNARMRSTAGELLKFLAGTSSNVDLVMRRGSVSDMDRLPPLRKNLALPASPVLHSIKPCAATPKSHTPKILLHAPKPAQSSLRWNNLHY